MKGLIAFIDILGYQSFLENNSATDSAKNVLRLVTDLPRVVNDRNQEAWCEFWTNNDEPPHIYEINVEHLIFSDTIVLLYKYPSEDYVLDVNPFAYFIIQAMELMSELFTNGLPSRGAIHEGEFINEGTCFAGRGIVEAYRLCTMLDFSGLVLTQHLSKWHASQPNFQAEHVFVNYLAPLKNGEERMTCLNWYMRIKKELRQKFDNDIIQFVSESFWAHRKDLPIQTDSKIRNTCKLIRKFKMLLNEEENNKPG